VTVAAVTAVGAAVDRVEGREKVTGAARYAYEHAPEGLAYAVAVGSSIAKGTVRAVHIAEAMALPGVLTVLFPEHSPRLHDVDNAELELFQSPRVAYRGQIVAAAVAETLEAARAAAEAVRIDFDQDEHDVVLRADHPGLYKPDTVNPSYETDTEEGDPDAALAQAPARIDRTYETPAFHNAPMEPHSTLAVWHGDGVTIYDSTQGATPVKGVVARAFRLEPERVRVISPHVGGGFGSKGTPRPQVILAVMASQASGRPVKVAVTRQQMFAVTGYRTPTIQRVRLGADDDGRLTAIVHDVVEQSSTLREFAEQTAIATRMMYASPNRRTTHRLARLDVPTPSWMRAPGECPGMYALESALDELAQELGMDPVDLRVVNDPVIDPESGHPFSSRNLVACLREGADRFGWPARDPRPAVRREGRFLVGTGVASSTYPARRRPSSASLRVVDGCYVFGLAAADIGTGARTVLAQIGADALEVPLESVRVEIGDSDLPDAPLAGGSMGTASWGSAIVKAARAFRAGQAADGVVEVDTEDEAQAQEPLSRHAFGAQFAAVRVDTTTGEVRVSRLLGVFAAGRIVNPKLARSQLVGGMTMGIGMALHEEGIMDAAFGDYVNHDLASYHVPACADVEWIDAVCIDEHDPHVNPMGAKGIGEIGIVGTAAAIANAVHHATGVRVRRLPIHPARLLPELV
jgi:xanthine dehydrogenase YagR molybdenum-binding subunit